MAVFIAAAGFYGMQDRLGAWWANGEAWWSAGREEPDWRQRELLFLKQAYDRLEAQRRQQAGNAPVSLRKEQDTILQRMQETAAPVRGKVPPEIRALLPEQPAETAKPEPAAAALATSPAPPPVVEPTRPEPAAVPSPAPGSVLEAARPEPAAAPAAPSPVPARVLEAAKPDPALASVVPAPAPVAAAEVVEPRTGSAPFARIEMGLSSVSRDPELDRLWEKVIRLRAKPPKPAESTPKPAEIAVKSTAVEPSGGAKQ